jgi:hypothetical protein
VATPPIVKPGKSNNDASKARTDIGNSAWVVGRGKCHESKCWMKLLIDDRLRIIDAYLPYLGLDPISNWVPVISNACLL